MNIGKLLSIGLMSAWLVTGNNAQAMVTTQNKKTHLSQVEFVPGEYLLQLKSPRASSRAFQKQLSGLGLSFKTVVNASEGLHLVQLNNKSRTQLSTLSVQALEKMNADLISQAQKLPEVRFLEPNFIYRAAAVTPNDLHFEQLWGMRNQGQADESGRLGLVGGDIKATEAWSLHTGSKDIVVAIIDTGVDYTHEDLKDNMWTDPETGTHGYNAINDTLDPMDDHSHGTHCAGSIGAVGNNGLGVAGVSWKVSLMGIKFLSAQGGGTSADAIKSIDFATSKKVHVMSNSWGGGGYSQALEEAIARAGEAGILFVAAAGNNGIETNDAPSYPASYPLDNIVSVAASNNVEEVSSFSNWGSQSVHLSAPGENILSTIVGNSYKSYSGTSMACPHVSGAAALLMAAEPELTAGQVKQRLMSSVDRSRSLRSRVVSMGRLNVDNLLRGVVTPMPVVPPLSAWAAEVQQAISTPHPYVNNTTQRWTFSHPGATFMRVRFARFALEAGYDKVQIYNAKNELEVVLTGRLEPGTWTNDIEGDQITVEFVSDHSYADYGFDLDAYSWTDYSGPTL